MEKVFCKSCGEDYEPEFVAEYFARIKPTDGYCCDKCYFKAKRETKKAHLLQEEDSIT